MNWSWSFVTSIFPNLKHFPLSLVFFDVRIMGSFKISAPVVYFVVVVPITRIRSMYFLCKILKTCHTQCVINLMGNAFML